MKTTTGINIILSLGRGDQDWVERALHSMPINLCVCITRYRDALPALPAKEYLWYEGHALDEVDWNTVRPLDEAVIESMRHAEAFHLLMQTRAERKCDISYQERKREYLQCLRYWNHILEEKGVDLFISNEIPHFGFVYVPYMLCKKLGIPTFFFQNMRLVQDVLFLMDNWEEPAPTLEATFQQLKREYADKDVELPEKFEKYLRSQTEKTADPTPWHMQGKGAYVPPSPSPHIVSFRAPKNMLSFLRAALLFLPRRLKLSYWQSHLQQFARERRRREQFLFYDTLAKPPDLSQRYVYLPLHMQPECTTCPMAGAYVDQQLIVQMLNALLPDDVLLYVKEHPDQGKRSFDIGCRSTDFYRDLLACKKVRLVPRTFSTFDLMEHAQAIATATGSPGFEALFRSKPVFMFGHRFFQHAPGVFHIHSTEDCMRAVREIFVNRVKPSLSDLRIFLKALDAIAIPASANPVDLEHSLVTPAVNARIIGDALKKRIIEKLGDRIVFKGEQPRSVFPPHVHRMLAN